MAATTPQPFVDAFFRFYADREFDDARVVGTVQELTGRAPRNFERWARHHAGAYAADT